MLSPLEIILETIIEIIGANIYEPFSDFVDKLQGRKKKKKGKKKQKNPNP